MLDAVELKYNEHLDKIVGFEEFNSESKSTQVAKEMMVFMMRGDFSDWKCIVSYFLSKNAITGQSLKSLTGKNIAISPTLDSKSAVSIVVHSICLMLRNASLIFYTKIGKYMCYTMCVT